jgi:hypothetical protein
VLFSDSKNLSSPDSTPLISERSELHWVEFFEANSRSSGHILLILWSPRIHHRVHTLRNFMSLPVISPVLQLQPWFYIYK